MKQKALVIGAGFAGISAAASLAKEGYDVTVLEKNEQAGGRARVLREQGFTFDMGPSWYWMPDVFEAWFARFDQHPSDHYNLVRLDPSYQVVYSELDHWKVPADRNELRAFFEAKEVGAGQALDSFLEEARVKYELGMRELVHRPSLSWLEFVHPKLIGGLFRSAVFRSMRSHVARYFTDERLRKLMEFPVLFLGATPENTPALYSLMNYADMALGTWYPMGGIGRVVDGMLTVARSEGAKFRFNQAVEEIIVRNGRVAGVRTSEAEFPADVVVGAADYNHVEQHLLAEEHRTYTGKYWNDRVMAPSSLLLYLGFDVRLPNLNHHNLFFDASLDAHAHAIYKEPRWPEKPLMYFCVPSITDGSVAPAGHENVFALIPVAPGLADSPLVREHYTRLMLDRLAAHTGIAVQDHLVYQRSYCGSDFQSDYNAFRGNAYGLANTLRQTAVLKPSVKSAKVRGLYFAGQLTVPGPGVPPALISGQLVADLIVREHSSHRQRA
ncbi:MAG: phytoene desaturase [Flavobacteriales bacterium]|nr:phytoene desaturase [Flavobacteriales bacterium]